MNRMQPLRLALLLGTCLALPACSPDTDPPVPRTSGGEAGPGERASGMVVEPPPVESEAEMSVPAPSTGSGNDIIEPPPPAGPDAQPRPAPDAADAAPEAVRR